MNIRYIVELDESERERLHKMVSQGSERALRTACISLPFVLSALVAAQTAALLPKHALHLIHLLSTGATHVMVSFLLSVLCVLLLRARIPEHQYLYTTGSLIFTSCWKRLPSLLRPTKPE